MNFSVRILSFLSLLCAVSTGNAQEDNSDVKRKLADFSNSNILNDFLSGKEWGGANVPGPCPTFADRCTGDIENAPDYVLDINVNVPDRIEGFSIVYEDKPIREVVSSGVFDLWHLELEDPQLDLVAFSEVGYSESSPGVQDIYRSKLDVNNIQAVIKTRIRGTDVTFEMLGISIDINEFVGDLTVDASSGIDTYYGLEFKAEAGLGQSNTGANSGVNFNNNFFDRFDFTGPNGEKESLDRSGNGACNLVLPDNGISLTFTQPIDLDLGFFLNLFITIIINFVIDVVIQLLKAFIEGIFCEVVVQLAYIKLDGDLFHELGGINQAVDEVYTTVQEYRAEGIKTRQDFTDLEAFMLSSESPFADSIEPEKAINFKTDPFFEGLSFGLNNILGGPSSNVNYDFVINEVADRLLNSTTGIFDVPDVKSRFRLSDEDVTYTLQFDAAGVTGKLKSFQIGGLNTFNKFRALDNNFKENPTQQEIDERFDYTLTHEIGLNTLSFKASFELQFLPGIWVNVPANPTPSEVITVNFELTISELDVNASTFTLIQPELLNDVQVGQIFGPDADILGNCSGKVLDHLNISGLAISFLTLSALSLVSDENDPIDDLIAESLTLINSILLGGFESQLDTIVENGVRPFLNDQFEDLFVDPDAFCEPYTPQVYDPESFQVADALFFSSFTQILDSVIGGDPIDDNDADINSILDIMIQYFLIDSPTLDGPEIVKIDRGDYEVVEKIDFGLRSGTDYFNGVIGGLIINNFDSISSLVVNQTGSPIDPYAAQVVFEWGHHDTKPVSPLSLCFPVVLNATLNGDVVADENFCIQLDVSLDIDFELMAQIDIDRTYQLTFGELQNVACLFAILNDKELRTINLEIFDFEFSYPGSFSADTNLGRNLSALNATSGPVALNFLNYLLDRVETELTSLVNSDFDPPYDIATCATVESPLGNTSFGSIPNIDFDAINEAINEATIEQGDPRDVTTAYEFEKDIVPEGGEVFDITSDAYEFISILSGAVTPENVRSSMITLANSTVDPASPSVFDPLIEILSLDENLNGSVILSIDLSSLDYDPEVEGLIEGLKVNFHPLTIRNVENFDTIKLIQPFLDANFTTENNFVYNNADPERILTVEFGVDIEVAGVVIGDLVNPILRESISTTIEISEVDIEVLLSVAVDPDKLKNVLMGDIFEFDFETELMTLRNEGLNCTLPQTIYPGGFHFPQLSLVEDSVISTPKTVVNGTLFSEELLGVVDSFLDIFIRAFSKELPNVTQGPVRQLVNQLIADTLLEIGLRECKDFEIPDFSGLPTGRTFNFETSDLSDEIDFFIQNDLLPPGKPLDINNLLRSAEFVTEGISKFEFESPIIYNSQDLGTVGLAVGDFRLPGLGSTYNPVAEEGARITDLKLLLHQTNSSNPRRVINSIEFEGRVKSSVRLAYTFDGLFEPTTGGADVSGPEPFLSPLADTAVYNDLTITLDIENLFVELLIDIGMDLEAFLNISAGNLLNLYDTPSDITCYLAIFEEQGLVPIDFTFEFTDIAFEIECSSICNSPDLEFLQAGGSAGTPEEVNEALTTGLEAAIDLFEILIAESDAQDYLNAAIETARKECINTDILEGFTLPVGEDIIDAAYFMGIGAMSFFFCGGVFFLTCIPRHKKRKQAVLKNAAGLKAEGNTVDINYVKRKMLPLISHPAIGPVARFAVPSILFIAAIFFIGANFFSVGASVALKLKIFGNPTEPVSLLDFTLAVSINDAWNAEAYPLAIAVAAASGFWPYVKLSLLFLCWLAPATVLASKSRGSLALWLDVLGKWSLIDAYVLIILQVGFRFFITSSTISQLDFVSEDILVVDVVVKPGFGIFGFLVGTILSLLTNHYIIYAHRKASDDDEQLENSLKGYADTSELRTRKSRLSRHRFFIDDEKFSYGYGRGIEVIVVFLIGLSLVLVVVGLFLPILRLEFGGVVGFLISFVDSESSQTVVSSIDIMSAVSDGASTDTKTQMGILFLQLVYIIFIAITPLTLIALYVIAFFAKLTLKEQKYILVAAEIIFAWEALIILVVSYLGAVFQISQLASFIANSATGDLCSFLEEQLIGFGLDNSDAKCLDVIASIEPSGYPLILGTFVLGATSIIMFRLLHYAVEDRELLNKYKVARKAGNTDQMDQLKRRAHHPLKLKGVIAGPLLRVACVKYRRRTKGSTAKSYVPSTFVDPGVSRSAPAPQQSSRSRGIFGGNSTVVESASVVNPMGPIPVLSDDDSDIDV
eukprot:CAMPEP_0184055970 /NCGR_PEP_ID=MMETSP0956-20121227/7496_1 /TAXON_ID=627963 /ORGANISM="Aplanochytrium sp, Strain PBS07" /LENGTH=2235 /DNA_ID=CAMNT_0026349901 /DNA_START=355 /DNA_END=7061 /DNA_ORIENTATION=+